MNEENEPIQSLGGRARAQKLSSEERSEIARGAAAARWDKEGSASKVPKATFGSPDRPLCIGDAQIPCYVLEDGRRVITQNGVLTALEMSPGTATKGGGDRVANFINTKSLNSYVSSTLREMIINPIRFRAQSALAYGYDATILPEICDAVLTARLEKKLNYQQEHIAKQCEILLRAFARVGIIALVDEATGYQEVRDRRALEEVLKKYISGALFEWAQTFPIEFYKQLFRLKGWAWNAGKMPPVVGKYVNDLVYDRLTPGVLAKLRELNPRDERGRRKNYNYNYFTPGFGHPALVERLRELVGMEKACEDGEWDRFKRVVDRNFPKLNQTIPLALPES